MVEVRKAYAMGIRFFKTGRRQKGAILFELIVSLMLLSMSIAAIMSVSGVSSKLARQAEMRAWAMSVARLQLEKLCENRQSNRRVASEAAFTIPADLLERFPGGTSTTQVSGTYTVLNVSGSENLQQITVVVTWSAKNFSSSNRMTNVTVSKIVASVDNLSGNPYDGDDDGSDPYTYFYDPPPPPPPVTSTGGSTGGTGGTDPGSTGTTTGGTTGEAEPPVEPGSSGGSTGGSDGGSTTGSSGGTTGGTTGSQPWMSGSYGKKF